LGIDLIPRDVKQMSDQRTVACHLRSIGR